MDHHDPDRLIGALSTIAPPAALADLEDRLAVSLRRRAADAAALRRLGTLSIAGALALGLVGGAVIGGEAAPAAAAPLGVDAALAPSTLLVGVRAR